MMLFITLLQKVRPLIFMTSSQELRIYDDYGCDRDNDKKCNITVKLNRNYNAAGFCDNCSLSVCVKFLLQAKYYFLSL